HGFMVTQSIQNTLPAGLCKVHILLCKGASIFARTQIERCHKTSFIKNRQYPANNMLSTQCDLNTFRCLCINVAFFIESNQFASEYCLIGPLVTEVTFQCSHRHSQVCKLHSQNIMAEIEKEI